MGTYSTQIKQHFIWLSWYSLTNIRNDIRLNIFRPENNARGLITIDTKQFWWHKYKGTSEIWQWKSKRSIPNYTTNNLIHPSLPPSVSHKKGATSFRNVTMTRLQFRCEFKFWFFYSYISEIILMFNGTELICDWFSNNNVAIRWISRHFTL